MKLQFLMEEFIVENACHKNFLKTKQRSLNQLTQNLNALERIVMLTSLHMQNYISGLAVSQLHGGRNISVRFKLFVAKVKRIFSQIRESRNSEQNSQGIKKRRR